MLRPRDAVGDPTREAPTDGATEIVDEMHERSDHSGDLSSSRESDDDRDGDHDEHHGEHHGDHHGDHRGERDGDLEGGLHDLVARDPSRDPSSDPVGDLANDPDEVWFDAETLAAASQVDLGADLLDVEHLGRAPEFSVWSTLVASPGISLAQLPGWPNAGSAGQGLGDLGDELIGELRVGELVLISGARRGVGRTSLLAQLGDGLALAHGGGRPATPVLFVSHDPPALWRARSLARYFGVDPRVFLDSARARREPRFEAMLREWAASSWAVLDQRQRFVGPEALGAGRSATIEALRRWSRELSGTPGSPTPVWPVVIVDPLEQLEGGVDQLDQLDQLAQLAELARREEWIVLASCEVADAGANADIDADIDADADAGWGSERARAVDRHASVRIRVAPGEAQSLGLELCHRRLGPRGAGRLRWQHTSGRFGPWE